MAAYSQLVSGAIDPTTVNICSGRAIHLCDIPKIMADISGHSLKIVTDASLLRSDEPRIIVGSPARLESLVGPLPNPEFRETLLDIYEACKSQAGQLDSRQRSVSMRTARRLAAKGRKR